MPVLFALQQSSHSLPALARSIHPSSARCCCPPFPLRFWCMLHFFVCCSCNTNTIENTAEQKLPLFFFVLLRHRRSLSYKYYTVINPSDGPGVAAFSVGWFLCPPLSLPLTLVHLNGSHKSGAIKLVICYSMNGVEQKEQANVVLCPFKCIIGYKSARRIRLHTTAPSSSRHIRPSCACAMS